jgi:hypothetical protein
MTTIAWDGRTLAADKQLTASGVRYETTKAHRLKDGSLFASCGSLENNAAALLWLNGDGEKPVFNSADSDDSFDGILVTPDGIAWLLNKKLHKVRIESPYFSTGSGRDFALLAMRLGKTAREAVEMAAELDIWTGMGVTELTLKVPDNVVALIA